MDYKVTDTELTSVANAIRTKGGTSAQLTFPNDFVTAIGNISGGGGSTNILSGTNEPTSNLGSDGDIYLHLNGIIQGPVDNTSDLTKVTVTANSYWTNFEPQKAFSKNTGWIGCGGNPHWIQLEFKNAISITGLNFSSLDSTRSHAISRVGASNDGITFTNADINISTMQNNYGNLELNEGCVTKFLRLYFDGEYGVSQYPMVGELCIYGAMDNIGNAYCKVNGTWQNLINTNIEDVNTGD